MKSGASDPFGDEEEFSDEEEVEETGGDAAEAEATEADAVETDASEVETGEMDDGDETGGDVEDVAEELAEDAVDDEIDRSDIPWMLRRDTVKDDRPHVHQLFVRDDTDAKARRAESRLEERLDTDVYRLDAREAIYLVGMEHLDEVAELLEEWGYNF